MFGLLTYGGLQKKGGNEPDVHTQKNSQEETLELHTLSLYVRYLSRIIHFVHIPPSPPAPRKMIQVYDNHIYYLFILVLHARTRSSRIGRLKELRGLGSGAEQERMLG